MKKDFSYPIGFYITRTQRELQKYFLRKLKTYKITPEQMLLLASLSEEKGISPTSVSFSDKPYITKLIGNLEKRGYVRREANPNDKRSCLLFLTKQGNDLRTEIIPILLEINAWAAEKLSGEEIEQLKMLLNKVYDHIKD